MEGLAGIGRVMDEGQWCKCIMEDVRIDCKNYLYDHAWYALHPIAYFMSGVDGKLFPESCGNLGKVRM